jgi:hypothetical protein
MKGSKGMIAQPDASAETMLRALAYTLAALEAAADLDADTSAEDRVYFADEKTRLLGSFEQLEAADHNYTRHQVKEMARLQARVILGDNSLDRGVRAAKIRLKVETLSSRSGNDEEVFGTNLSDIVEAPLRNEPGLVQQALVKLDLLPDFPTKAEIKADLASRVERQIQVLKERDEGEYTRIVLKNLLLNTIMNCSETLYKLEKRLLERFPRDRGFVRQFFMDTASPKRAKMADQPQA